MKKSLVLLGFVAAAAAPLAQADITVGVTVSATGPAASIGVPYRNAFTITPTVMGGQKVRYIVLDDATDTTGAVRNARKLVSEDRVDVILGSATTPTSLAVAEVAAETKTPQIALAPIAPPPDKYPWVFWVAQPVPLMIAGVVDHMKANGVKSVGYIGYNDPWGEIVLKGLTAATDPAGIKIVANERFNRPDTSVSAQILKIMATAPDAVMVGGSGTPGALPQITLAERGFKGRVYQTHGVIGQDFIRIGGKNVEGAIAPSGPVMVADQLPDSNPIRKVASDFIKAYEAQYGANTRNAFSAYSYDATLLVAAAVPEALKKAKPGTPEFRSALRDALEGTRNVVGTHGVYNMTPQNHNGMDERARVMVRVENGEWRLLR
ncbi:MAG TPA: ABC transporter substrate-binding protein [Burkholderiales bacterium]|nr:ABC transporter substrate-binding protein [Burkholderiales bacterium]